MRLICTYEQGIHVIVVPLLALGIQLNLLKHSRDYGHINVVNLDEHYKDFQKRQEFIDKLKRMPKSSKNTTIMLTSPQFIAIIKIYERLWIIAFLVAPSSPFSLMKLILLVYRE